MEVSQIMRKIVSGCAEFWKQKVIHRDIKLANILLHFPDHPEVGTMTKEEKMQFLKTVNLESGNFKAVVSDFGMSTIVKENSNHALTICGTPLYSSPELLKKKGYSYKVDIWAIGIIAFELLQGQTPFHSKNLKELLSRIHIGDYTASFKDQLSIECANFLAHCL